MRTKIREGKAALSPHPPMQQDARPTETPSDDGTLFSALHTCSLAFQTHPPDVSSFARARALLVEAEARAGLGGVRGHYEEEAWRLVAALERFADFVVGPDSNSAIAMSEFLSQRVTVVSAHELATTTFLLKYMVQRRRDKGICDEVLITFVHDVTCNTEDSVWDAHSKQDLETVIDCIGRSHATCLASEICTVTSLLDAQAAEGTAMALLNALERLYLRVSTSGWLMSLRFIQGICDGVIRPGVLGLLHFNKSFVDMLVSDVMSILDGSARPNVHDGRLHIGLVVARYMNQGVYYRNMMFLRLGPSLERSPWLPLVDLFATGVPSYPFPTSTWELLMAQGRPPGTAEQEKRLLTLVEDQTRRTLLDMHGRRTDIDTLLPGEWFCRVTGHVDPPSDDPPRLTGASTTTRPVPEP